MKEIIVLMGGPGSGKGTVAEKICDYKKINKIETGALFRSLPPYSEISKIISTGALVPDTELFKLIESKISVSEDTLLDGFPRTLPQAKWLINNYSNDFAISIIYLDIPEEVMKQRIKNRLNNGSTRADDNCDKVILKRLDTFHEITIPAINWLHENEIVKFFYIDAKPAIEDVISQVYKILP